MSTLFRARRSDAERSSRDLDALLGDDRETGRYLTDGINLYRSLGAMVHGPRKMVALENCRSLEIMLIPLGDLPRDQLRPVVPADQVVQA